VIVWRGERYKARHASLDPQQTLESISAGVGVVWTSTCTHARVHDVNACVRMYVRACIDMCADVHALCIVHSNDYLGLARSAQLAENVRIAYSRIIGHLSESTPMLGSTGSRLLTGNSPVHERLET
jgi:7-keto-8-aminopelargonate synthetase-like enzyme